MKKIKMNKIWAPLEQTVFAIFIVVAFYGIGFATKGLTWRGMNPTEVLNNAKSVNGGNTIQCVAIYGLSISAIVLAFAGIIPLLISMLFSFKKMNFYIGWAIILIDIAALSTSTAAVSLWVNNLTIYGEIQYSKGYAAGQFIFIFVGAGVAFFGIAVSYKKDLLKIK